VIANADPNKEDSEWGWASFFTPALEKPLKVAKECVSEFQFLALAE
jgi:hypothetical protein